MLTSIEKSPSEKVETSIHPLYIIAALFFVFGFLTWLNSVLIPYLKLACQLNNFQSYLVAFAFYIAYFFMAIPSSRVLKITGFKRGMSVGLLIIAIGALIFIPAALTRTYGLFLTGLFVQGTGLAMLQTASNPYVTILGPIESAAKRISIMGIFNKLAGALAPVILGSIALKDADGIQKRLATVSGLTKEAELAALSHRVILPYIVIVVCLILLAFFVHFSNLPAIQSEQDTADNEDGGTRQTSILQFPHLLLGVLSLFLYIGAEVMAGDSIISYGASQGIPLSTAKFFTTSTMVGMMAGYLIGIVGIPRYFSQETALKVCAFAGLIFSLSAVFTHGYLSVFFVALLGFANSLVWPALWPLALSGLGKFTKSGASLLIMAIAGGALIPLLYGFVVDGLISAGEPKSSAATHGYWVLIPCYLFIAYYAIAGHKLKPIYKH